MQGGDFVGDGKVFFLGSPVDDIRIFDAAHRLVCRNDDNVELVNLVELGGLGFGGTGHAGEFFVETEVILEGDGGQGLVFTADIHAFLGFYCLVQSVGPAAPRHQAAREFVDDDDFAVFHHVLHIAPVERVRLDGDFDVVLQVPVLNVGNVADAEQPLDLLPAFVGDTDRLVL